MPCTVGCAVVPKVLLLLPRALLLLLLLPNLTVCVRVRVAARVGVKLRTRCAHADDRFALCPHDEIFCGTRARHVGGGLRVNAVVPTPQTNRIQVSPSAALAVVYWCGV